MPLAQVPLIAGLGESPWARPRAAAEPTFADDHLAASHRTAPPEPASLGSRPAVLTALEALAAHLPARQTTLPQTAAGQSAHRPMTKAAGKGSWIASVGLSLIIHAGIVVVLVTLGLLAKSRFSEEAAEAVGTQDGGGQPAVSNSYEGPETELHDDFVPRGPIDPLSPSDADERQFLQSQPNTSGMAVDPPPRSDLARADDETVELWRPQDEGVWRRAPRFDAASPLTRAWTARSFKTEPSSSSPRHRP